MKTMYDNRMKSFGFSRALHVDGHSPHTALYDMFSLVVTLDVRY